MHFFYKNISLFITGPKRRTWLLRERERDIEGDDGRWHKLWRTDISTFPLPTC